MADEDQNQMFFHCSYSFDCLHLLFRIFNFQLVPNVNSRYNITQLLYGPLLNLNLNWFGLMLSRLSFLNLA
uniref:Uncharacterized protein n=1 Tax=Cucumis melo TaxID=3656 RepID=A0A9I9E2C6_CUCME